MDVAGVRGAAAGADEPRRSRRHRPSGLQLFAGARRLCRAARSPGGVNSRTASRSRWGLPGARCIPRLGFRVVALDEGVRACEWPPARDRPAGLRRSRCDDCAARHRRRSRTRVSAREDPAGDRPRERQRRCDCTFEPPGSLPARASRDGTCRPTRRCGRPRRAARGRTRCDGAADSRRGLAAGSRRAQPRLRPQ